MQTLAKQQQSVALSSCEAELYALQSVAQEAIALSGFCHWIYCGLHECRQDERPELLLESDSDSALQLLFAIDVPKKSRHIEIRLSWLRSKIDSVIWF